MTFTEVKTYLWFSKLLQEWYLIKKVITHALLFITASSPYLASVKQHKGTSSLKNTSTIIESNGDTWKSFGIL